eukprot:4211645-Karenia_brevis.AAC.1
MPDAGLFRGLGGQACAPHGRSYGINYAAALPGLCGTSSAHSHPYKSTPAHVHQTLNGSIGLHKGMAPKTSGHMISASPAKPGWNTCVLRRFTWDVNQRFDGQKLRRHGNKSIPAKLL